MNALTNLLSYDWANALGWTLLHSLWQSMVILLTVLAVWRLFPSATSRIRYAIASAGLLLFLLSTAATFIYYYPGDTEAVVTTYQPPTAVAWQPVNDVPLQQKFFSSVSFVIQTYMPLILVAWTIGFFFFTIRLTAGIWYTAKLRAEAIPIENEWSTYMESIRRKLGIARFVTLAESASIDSPMVIGYLKPVILLPLGILTGLTTEQLETVFVHELAHIKRHDYLINLVQSFLETIFFFNPFVWILSNLIRREREYCCDDLVMQHHGGARAYAFALTHLAEARISSQTFALSLAADKNQLLNRIRRIMEKSAKTYYGKTRMVLPLILLTGALLCISWLGIQQKRTPQTDTLTLDQDTIIDDKKKGAFYSRKSVITIDENGQPHEEIVEQFEGDEDLRPMMKAGIPDSLPHPFDFRDHQAWEEMAKAFDERFYEFSLHNADLEKLMKEFEEKFQSEEWTSRFDSLVAPDGVLQKLQELEELHELDETLEHLRHFKFEDLRTMERDLEKHSSSLRSYEQVLRQELIKDGYLSEEETIESLQWDDTIFKVNGKKIKDTDLKKYQDIQDNYFNVPPPSGKVE